MSSEAGSGRLALEVAFAALLALWLARSLGNARNILQAAAPPPRCRQRAAIACQVLAVDRGAFAWGSQIMVLAISRYMDVRSRVAFRIPASVDTQYGVHWRQGRDAATSCGFNTKFELYAYGVIGAQFAHSEVVWEQPPRCHVTGAAQMPADQTSSETVVYHRDGGGAVARPLGAQDRIEVALMPSIVGWLAGGIVCIPSLPIALLGSMSAYRCPTALQPAGIQHCAWRRPAAQGRKDAKQPAIRTQRLQALR